MSLFLALPNYGCYEPQSLFTIMGCSKEHKIKPFAHTSSMLVDSFNTCWCEMLNTPDMSHFAMLHADIHTDVPWIDILVREMDKQKLDILSVVVPLKDEKGITSTAVLQKDNTVKRLTLKEVYELPETFTTAQYEGTLLVNTGMWIAKVGDWMKEFDGFRAHSQIVLKNGKYETMNSPEDWDFSVWCAEKGLKVGATRIISVGHIGKKSWRNDSVYGLDVDA